MSVSSPYIRLAIDWQDSPMFSRGHGVPEPATMGERLAWVMLLCHVRALGRGGKATVRKTSFIEKYGLTERAYDGMMHRAKADGAVEVKGDLVTIKCWRCYQGDGPHGLHICTEKGQVGGSCESSPSWVGYPGFLGFWSLWPKHHRKCERKKCAEKWKAGGCEANTDEILASLTAWKASAEWAKDGGDFIPAPLVWLNQERWRAAPPRPAGAPVGAIPNPLASADEAMRLIPKRKGA